MKSLLLSFLCLLWISGTMYAQNQTLSVGLGGNAYVTEKGNGANISDSGVTAWTNPASVIRIFFYVAEPGVLDIALKAKGNSGIKMIYNGKSYKMTLNAVEMTKVHVGKIEVKKPGYVEIGLQGVSKTGETFGEVSELIVGNVTGKAAYVKDFSNYWGRRGPSVHLSYQMPKENTEWFYNEVTVPKDGETLCSYYMANGFGEGYFGIQYNSEKERRVLFSVWSPFDTQDPKLIPKEDQIKMLRKGEDVHIGEFGNEGSGGQSYLKYNWKAGNTYKFLMHVKPDEKGNTTYTAYFYATDENRWRLIASFMRPKTNTWYTRAHSFLENFSPEQGYHSRRVIFGNQWALGSDDVWREMTNASFSYDATADSGVRLDYQGGREGKNSFYLKNGGFFNENTKAGAKFDRPAGGVHPEIDFKALEKL